MKTMRAKTITELLGAPPPGKTGRERLIWSAIDLFYQTGFHAVGIDQVIEVAGVTKTTFYKYFESKDDLIVAAIQLRDEWETLAWERAVIARAGMDPAKRLLAFFDVLDEWFNAPDYNGCIFMNAAGEFPNPHDPIHMAAKVHKQRMWDGFRQLASEADMREPSVFTDGYMALLEGALIMRQSQGRNDAARAVKPAVQALMREQMMAIAV